MPNYAYRAQDPAAGCDQCQEAFSILQALSEPALESCPQCQVPLRRVIGGSQCLVGRRWNTKQMLSDGNLKRLGFKKMVKEGEGKYRDVLAD